MSMNKGKFIVFEGIDGSGKTTQIQLLKDALQLKGILIYNTCEPSERPIGKLIRKVLKKEIKTTNDVLAALYLSDRLDHLQNDEDGIVIKLNAGITVISDRYYMSSMAYNSLKSPMSWVYDLNKKAMDIYRPDITIYLKLEVSKSLHRINSGRETTELFEKEDVLTQVSNNYDQAIELLHPHEKIVIINADQDPELIHAEIIEAISSILQD